MAWFGSERTGASGPRAFLELAPPRRKPPHFPPKDVTASTEQFMLICLTAKLQQYLSEASRSDNLWARTRSRYGPPRELMVYTETSILNSSPIVPMPGMHAPRGGKHNRACKRPLPDVTQQPSTALRKPKGLLRLVGRTKNRLHTMEGVSPYGEQKLKVRLNLRPQWV